jgi:cell division protein FtsA
VSGLIEATENPSFATGVGLLLHGYRQQYEKNYHIPAMNDTTQSLWARMKEWFQGNF